MLTADASGTPQRTRGPGSASASGLRSHRSARPRTTAPNEPRDHGETEGARATAGTLSTGGCSGVAMATSVGTVAACLCTPRRPATSASSSRRTPRRCSTSSTSAAPCAPTTPTGPPTAPAGPCSTRSRTSRALEAMVAGEPEPDVDVSHHAHVRHAFGAKDRAVRRVPPRPRPRGGARRARGAPRRAARLLPLRHRVGRARGAGALRNHHLGRPARRAHLRHLGARAGRPRGPRAPRRPRLRRRGPRREPAVRGAPPHRGQGRRHRARQRGRARPHRARPSGGPVPGSRSTTARRAASPCSPATPRSTPTSSPPRSPCRPRSRAGWPAGRRSPDDLHVVVHGDDDVARRVMAAMAITP